MPETGPPGAPPAGAESNRNLMLVLAYLGPLCLIPLLTEKDDAELQWHAHQGLLLFAIAVALFVFDTLLALTLHPLACLLSLLMPLVFLAYIAVLIAAILKALEGKRLILPVLSDLAKRF